MMYLLTEVLKYQVSYMTKSSTNHNDADDHKLMSQISSYLSCLVTAPETDYALGFYKSRVILSYSETSSQT